MPNLLHSSAHLEFSQGPGRGQNDVLSCQRRRYKVHRKRGFLGTHCFPRYNPFSLMQDLMSHSLASNLLCRHLKLLLYLRARTGGSVITVANVALGLELRALCVCVR